MTSMRAKKHDADFQVALRKHAKLDEATGDVKFDGLYASCYINVCWKGGIISLPHAHLACFLTHGHWPAEDMIIDHKNDDPMDNQFAGVDAHREPKKRRGRVVYRSYGSGRYDPAHIFIATMRAMAGTTSYIRHRVHTAAAI
jgi:hypothetical protein